MNQSADELFRELVKQVELCGDFSEEEGVDAFRKAKAYLSRQEAQAQPGLDGQKLVKWLRDEAKEDYKAMVMGHGLLREAIADVIESGRFDRKDGE